MSTPKILTTLRHNLWWRGPLHKFIAWYLRRCGGAFHVYPYGKSGRYVVLVTENGYSAMEADKALDRMLREALKAEGSS